MARFPSLAIIVVLAAAAGPGCSCDPAGIATGPCSSQSECAPGEQCREGLCVTPGEGCALTETDCANDSDDDCDALSDCADPDCSGRDCASSDVCAMATCSGSTCVENFRPSGTECRPLSGDCDLAEVCPGNSAECPSETYLPEGTPCGACQTCDGIGGCNPAEDGTACGLGLSCLSGDCVGCGDAQEPCCSGGLCNGALACDEGLCGDADAGAADAGVDSGVPDAGATDAGRVDAGPVVKVTVVMAGDIVQSGTTTVTHARQNAALINAHVPKPAWIMAIGDNARYSSGATISLLSYYQTYWKPAAAGNWGQFDSKMFPVPGNHEYNEANAKGYFDYFANRFSAIAAMPSYHGFAGTVGRGYYSFDINGWHFIGLNSDCSAITGGCAVGGAQYLWLKADLAAHANMPIVAYFHHPRYFCNSGSPAGSITSMQPFWAALYDARADFVFAGHLHVYERFKPMNKAQPAVVDLANGVTQIIVGDSGVSSGGVCAAATDPRIAKQKGGDAGIGSFFFTIGSDGSYSFKYVLLNGTVFDSGSGWSRHRP